MEWCIFETVKCSKCNICMQFTVCCECKNMVHEKDCLQLDAIKFVCNDCVKKLGVWKLNE